MNRWPWWYRAPIVVTSLLPLLVSRRAKKHGYGTWNLATAVLSSIYWAYPTPVLCFLDRVNACAIIGSHLRFVFFVRPRDNTSDLYLILSGIGIWCFRQSKRCAISPNAVIYHAMFHIVGNIANGILYRT